jgi:GNAT superfamily N-acetyltransferase
MEATPRGVVITEVIAEDPELAAVRELLHEYLRSEAARVRGVQGGEAEIAGLPGAYAPPSGSLLLAELGGRAAGCVALRDLGGGRCEMKRLYVRAAFRGAGLAGRLVERIIDRARTLGYREMYLDTLPEMRAARLMYDMLGFRACSPYLTEPTPGADCMVLDLGKG